MVQAVIFDCFGVIADENWKPYLRRVLGGNDEKLQEALFLNQKADAGHISYEDFLTRAAQVTEVPQATIRAKIENHRADDAVLRFIESDLKGRYKLGLLSNVPADWLAKFLTPSQRALFDVVTLSYEFGVAKPDLRIYQITAEQLQLKPDECLFVDDQPVNCAGAVEAGMRAIPFIDLDQLKSDLTHLP